MSATNHTTTIGLSQYISTDKPTYLTDYNGDMLAIDNAIASDRDGIATAQNKANTADGKADANKTSIDTLDAQINGDPSDPSDTGLAGKVTGIDGEVDTIEALIGNGTPTTSNQTIIGAINGLEGAIAPREDGANLANDYEEGEQFARGGSVYTALVPLTAGTAFASLTLNTDYKNSETLVEQIANAGTDVSQLESDVAALKALHPYSTLYTTICDVTGDGVKTVSELLVELDTAFATAMENLEDTGVIIAEIRTGVSGVPALYANHAVLSGNNRHFTSVRFFNMNSSASALNIFSAQGSASSWHLIQTELSTGVSVTDLSSTVVDNGTKLSVIGAFVK